jgi:hypothetical protein
MVKGIPLSVLWGELGFVDYIPQIRSRMGYLQAFVLNS